MITTDLSKGQLTIILSALCGVQRHPASRADAIAAIEKQAKAIDLGLDDIFAAADGLLDERMTAAAWRATLRGEADAEATAAEAPTSAPEAEPANEPATDEPAAPTAPEGGTGGATETQPEARVSVKEQLLAACEAADYWLQAELQRPGETRPDDILRVLRAAIARAGQPRRATTGEPPKPPRTDSKQARLIAMLHQGASISEMASELGWLRHTCHGALAGLKKKRGLRITSDKHAGGERVYHMVSA